MKTINIDSNINVSRSEFLDIIKELPKSSFEICFKYKSNFLNTKNIRDFIGFIFDYYGFSEMWKTRFILIADELNNNAIEYGSRWEEYNELRLNISETGIKNYKIKVEVEDTGKWITNKTATEMCKLAEKKKARWFDNYDSIRWRWLFLIIDQMVDKLYFKDSKKWWLIVWLKKEISLDKETMYCAYSLEERMHTEEKIKKAKEKFEKKAFELDEEHKNILEEFSKEEKERKKKNK